MRYWVTPLSHDSCSHSCSCDRLPWWSLCAVRCGWMMVLVRVDTAFPVRRDIVLTFRMPTHTLRPRKHLTTYVTHTVECRHPCRHRGHAPFACDPPVCRSMWTLYVAPASAMSLWRVPSGEVIGPQRYSSSAAMNSKLHACSLWWSWTAAQSAVIHDISVKGQCNRSLLFRNDVRIIDVRLTSPVSILIVFCV